MRTTKIRFAGFGGQGIVKAAEIFGIAALADGLRALQNQSYGSSARGGLCTADVVVSQGDIHEIEPHEFDILVVMSQGSCQAFLPQLMPQGLLVFEQDLVQPPENLAQPSHSVPATLIATREIGHGVTANMVMLGFCGAITGLLHRPSLERAILSNVPKTMSDINGRAFERGWALGAVVAADKKE